MLKAIAGRAMMASLVAVQCTTDHGAPPSGSDDSRGTCAAAVSPVIVRECFEDARFEERGWYDNTATPIGHAEHAPGGTGAAIFAWRKGDTKPLGGDAMRHAFPAGNSIYVGYKVKYSPGWIGSGKPYHPHEFYVLSNKDDAYDGPSYNWLTLYIEQNFDHGGRPRLSIQDSKAINANLGALPLSLLGVTVDMSVGGCNGAIEEDLVVECYNAPPWTNNKQLRGPVTFRDSPGAGYISDWNQVEAYFQLNTVRDGQAQRDGIMQYWFNGALVIDRHDILFRTAARADLKLDKFLIAPYMGDGSPIDQTMWVDDLVLATRRPGTP